MSTITIQNKKSVNLTKNLYQREKWITKLDQMAPEYTKEKIKRTLELLYEDRQYEFKE